MTRSFSARCVRTAGVASFGILVFAACAVPSEGESSGEIAQVEDGVPVAPEVEDNAVAEPVAEPMASALSARQKEAEACAARFAAGADTIDAKLREAGHDPEAVRREAEAIASLEGEARLQAMKDFEQRFRDVTSQIAKNIGLPSAPSAMDAEELPEMQPLLLRPSSLTHCAPPVIQVGTFNIRRTQGGGTAAFGSGAFRASASGGAANVTTNVATVGHTFSLSPDEARVRVTADVRIDRGHVKASGAFFGYANSGASLNMRVLENGRVVCSSPEIKLAEAHVNTGETSSTVLPSRRTLSCDYFRMRNRPSTISVELQAGAWIGVGGAAEASASIEGVLTELSVRSCTESGTLTGVQGLCVEPLFVRPDGRPQSGSPLRVAECLGIPSQKWTRTRLGQIQSRADVSLCIGRPGGSGIELVPCNAAEFSQRWGFPSDNTVRDNSTLNCFDAMWPVGGPSGNFTGSQIHLFRCNEGSQPNQTWRIAPL